MPTIDELISLLQAKREELNFPNDTLVTFRTAHRQYKLEGVEVGQDYPQDVIFNLSFVD